MADQERRPGADGYFLHIENYFIIWGFKLLASSWKYSIISSGEKGFLKGGQDTFH